MSGAITLATRELYCVSTSVIPRVVEAHSIWLRHAVIESYP